MKNLYCSLSILSIFTAFSLFAQNKSIPNPEFVNEVYFLDPKTNTLIALDRVPVDLDSRNRLSKIGRHEVYWTVHSPSSILKFTPSEFPKMYIKVMEGKNPIDIISLCKAEVKTYRRRFKMYSRRTLGKSRDVSHAFIPIEFKKVGDNVYQVILDSDMLNEGEYAFVNNTENTLFMMPKRVNVSCFEIEF